MNLYPGGVLEVSRDMRRVLNPENWDGVILGEHPNLGASSPEADKVSTEFALQALKSCLLLGYRGETQEDHVYLPGSTFDPAEHEPGTVVVYHQEALYEAIPGAPHIDLNIFRNRVPPKHPTELERRLGDKALVSFRAEATEAVGVVFQESIRYGVIPPDDGRKRRRLVTVPSGWIKPAPKQLSSTLEDPGVCRVVIDNSRRTDFLDPPRPKVERTPIPIGSVRHFRKERSKDADSPRLVRITRMDVLLAA